MATTTTFNTGQTWGALKKAWKGYRIAKVQGDSVNMLKYASRIRRLQRELRITVADFPDLLMRGSKESPNEVKE